LELTLVSACPRRPRWPSMSAAKAAFGWAVLLGIVGGGVGAVLLTKSIGRSTISTAALSFIELPVVMVLWAVPCAVMGFCAASFVAASRTGAQHATFRRVLAGAGLVAVALPSAAYVLANLATGWEVTRIQSMSEEQLEQVLASKCFGANPFVLAQVAQSPRANAVILRKIATRKDPELHEKLSSIFDVMGSNRHGLAVMRLVARNPNVDETTLELLAQSNNGYVLSDVAMNPKLQVESLRRLEQRADPILEWSISRNPKTSPWVLQRLAGSQDAHVRSNVASNPSTAPADLVRLASDPQFAVRRNVATNPSAPAEVIEALRQDPDAGTKASIPPK
jgi:Leucine rich repeat variant